MFVSLRPHRATWITAIVMLLIALALPVEAQQRGQLVLDQGLVKVSNGPKVRIYNVPGTTVLLSVDDQVHTARNSAARVILSSGDEVVTLQANTVFKVEKENELAAGEIHWQPTKLNLRELHKAFLIYLRFHLGREPKSHGLISIR